MTDLGKISDGYHTFDELYEHRNMLFCALVRNPAIGYVWKSMQHYDGTMYEGMFIAGIGLSHGNQISYHMPLSFWDKFDARVLEHAPEWDGHTSQDVLKRLMENF